MRMNPVDNANSPEVNLTCANCNDRISSRNAYADLDGEPFKAYYCDSCRRKLEYVEQSRPFQSVDDIRRISEYLGSHFFEPASMRFFNSRIAGYDVYGGKYFITSEQFVDRNAGIVKPRRYTIREITNDGKVNTAKGCEFQQFATLREAKTAVKQLA